MIRRHIVEFGLIILFLMSALIAVLMWWAGNYSTTVATAMLILVLLGTAAGTLIPNILLTWLIIGLSTIGIAILMMGYVVMTIPIKIGLLLAFPVCASLSTLRRSILSDWGWIDRNRAEINSYAEHYDQITKLQTKYNAQKIYKRLSGLSWRIRMIASGLTPLQFIGHIIGKSGSFISVHITRCCGKLLRSEG